MTELKYLMHLIILEISFLDLSFYFFQNNSYQLFKQRYFLGTFCFNREGMNTK